MHACLPWEAHGCRSVGFSCSYRFSPAVEMILLISCSLNPESRSRLLARAAHSRLVEGDEPVEFVDLQNVPLPLCDGGATYGDANARRLSELGSQADAILLAAPVYNYSA